jgi:hypothetical protein
VRFRNDGGKNYARAEAHLVYRTPGTDGTKVTFAWKDADGNQKASHTFAATEKETAAGAWTIPSGKNTQTRWVEFEPVRSQSNP